MRLSDRKIQLIVGVGAIVAPLLHTLTDVAEWAAGGFSLPQLWANYFSFFAIPFVVVGLYAFQRPKIGVWGFIGAILYGVSFVYFAHTTLYAIVENVADYEALWTELGAVYTAHGIAMILGGLAFGGATYQSRVFPAWTSVVFLSGISVNALLTVVGAPEILQTLGRALRNLGLIGMGLFLAARPIR